MKSKCIASYATGGQHLQFLDISSKIFKLYADKFDYDLRIVTDSELMQICRTVDMSYLPKRPAAWYKVPIIKNFLLHYETVLWLDADVIILNLYNDIYNLFKNNQKKTNALVIHDIIKPGIHQGARVPNTGIWLLRPLCIDLLNRIWLNTKYIDDGCWEQTAMLDNIKWDIFKCNNQETCDSPFVDLPYVFNIHEYDYKLLKIDHNHRIFYHATATNDRLGSMIEQSKLINPNPLYNHSLYSEDFRYIESIIDIINNIQETDTYCIFGNIPDAILDKQYLINKKFQQDNTNIYTNKFDHIFIFPPLEGINLSIFDWCIYNVRAGGHLYIYGYDNNLIKNCNIYYNTNILNITNEFCYRHKQEISGITEDPYKTCIIKLQ